MEKTFVEFNGKRYDISGKLIAQRTMWGYPKWYHRITVEDGEHTTVFPFYTPDNVLNDYELRFAVCCPMRLHTETRRARTISQRSSATRFQSRANL